MCFSAESQANLFHTSGVSQAYLRLTSGVSQAYLKRTSDTSQAYLLRNCDAPPAPCAPQVRALPGGIAAEVGERGVTLSGGAFHLLFPLDVRSVSAPCPLNIRSMSAIHPPPSLRHPSAAFSSPPRSPPLPKPPPPPPSPPPPPPTARAAQRSAPGPACIHPFNIPINQSTESAARPVQHAYRARPSSARRPEGPPGLNPRSVRRRDGRRRRAPMHLPPGQPAGRS